MKENFKFIALGAILFILGGLEARVKWMAFIGIGIMFLGFILWIKYDLDKGGKKNAKSSK